MLSAVAAILMYLEIPLPFVPPFLRLDFSDIPALLAGFSLGPMAGLAVVFIKNLVHAMASWSFLVGELANFIFGVAFVLPAAFIYKKHKNKKSAIIGMTTGSITMTITAGLLNAFVLIPLYASVLNFPLEAIISMSKEVNPLITDLKTLIFIGITPFNIVKAFLTTLITALIYKPLSPYLHK
ncbi:MAG: ECF transporter S component [Clostridia bacterium]|nr:ECF transporter S component [Clostridia bacterium]MBN2884166.1 ECF transporter S component [Clostridia bacterium]